MELLEALARHALGDRGEIQPVRDFALPGEGVFDPFAERSEDADLPWAARRRNPVPGTPGPVGEASLDPPAAKPGAFVRFAAAGPAAGPSRIEAGDVRPFGEASAPLSAAPASERRSPSTDQSARVRPPTGVEGEEGKRRAGTPPIGNRLRRPSVSGNRPLLPADAEGRHKSTQEHAFSDDAGRGGYRLAPGPLESLLGEPAPTQAENVPADGGGRPVASTVQRTSAGEGTASGFPASERLPEPLPSL